MPFWALLLLFAPTDLVLRNDEITVTAGAPFGGAISSIQWHGKEYLNSFDHGRELQSALSFDGYGECFNPTEGGSENDGQGSATSSRLLFGKVVGATLQTRTDMAFWMVPGQPYQRDCGTRKGFQIAKNETIRGGYIVEKTVTLRGHNLSIDLSFHVPNAHQSATFEILTGYMPPEFSEFLILKNGGLEPISTTSGEQAYPVVLATPDRQYAMGATCGSGKVTYGRFQFPNVTNKWNAVNRKTDIQPGDYKFHCLVAIGTAEDVRQSLAAKPE